MAGCLILVLVTIKRIRGRRVHFSQKVLGAVIFLPAFLGFAMNDALRVALHCGCAGAVYRYYSDLRNTVSHLVEVCSNMGHSKKDHTKGESHDPYEYY